MTKVLLVTIAIGDKYIKEYDRYFRKSQEEYAKIHRYDFRVVTDFLESSLSKKNKNAISFQKILVCSQDWSKEYDKIIFVDADVLINPLAPPIHLLDVGHKIGIIDEFTQPSFNERIAIQIRMGWERTAEDYYKLGDPSFELETETILNTGVLILQPSLHKSILESIYNTYVGKSIGHSRGFHFEQAAIGFTLQSKNMFNIINNKWNAIWALNKMSRKNPECNSLQTFYDSNYFIHFAGGVDIPLIIYLKR